VAEPARLPPTLYITANSPGEIAAFLRPVVRAAVRRLPDLPIRVILLPCTFATGREDEVARAIPGVSEVYPTRELWNLLRNRPPAPPAGLLHLGGDLMYAALLAWRWRMPAWAYQWAQKKWDSFFEGYFVKTENDVQRMLGQGIHGTRVWAVGDLIVDAVDAQLDNAPAAPVQSHPHILFMPGSRENEVRSLVPMYLGCAGAIARTKPRASFSILLSPFLDRARLEQLIQYAPDEKFGGLQGTLGADGMLRHGDTAARIVTEGHLQSMATADFVVTIPGTKTGESGSLGIPTLSIVPLNRFEELPYFGIVGLLDWIPMVGKHLKGWVLEQLSRRPRPYFAQPNILAGRDVIPEIVDVVSPELIAERVLALLDEPSRTVLMRQQLLDLYRPFRGASERMLDVIGAHVQSASRAKVAIT
jgi:lipid-A-disaccharide synthase